MLPKLLTGICQLLGKKRKKKSPQKPLLKLCLPNLLAGVEDNAPHVEGQALPKQAQGGGRGI